MKTNLLLLLILLNFSLPTRAQTTLKSKDALPVPKIEIIYLRNGVPFDKECSSLLNKPIRQEDMDELFNQLDEFKQAWEKDGPLYFEAALKEVGVPFPYHEMQATLTLCDFSSMSSPLIMNVRKFLLSAQKPLPIGFFPELLFHEIMHTYTRAVYDISPLRKKYSNELPVILNHLHSMALEKLVLTKLDRTELLNWLDNRYRNQFGPDYKRAWEIVSDIEGYEAFINELKRMR